ncbi:MAG: sigma-54 dependent transcriptional regulator [Bacteroidota bacterium]
MQHARILLLDFDVASDLGRTLRRILEGASDLQLEVRCESPSVCELPSVGRSISKVISDSSTDLVFCVLSRGVLAESCKLLRRLRIEGPGLPIVVVMEADDPKEMFELLEIGIADFVTPPLKAIDIIPRILRLQEQTHRRQAFTEKLKQKLGLKQLVGESPAFIAEIRKIPLVAKSDVNVLLFGETGTGKELCARAIHYLSPRAHKPFVAISCGAIPVELMENELFGHERGAYTSAATSQIGLIQDADGGTLFLDEIDCLSLLAQVKLLRFLQEKEYRPLGSARILQADVRIIAATNINLERAVKEGKLRQDLYYRLNTIALRLPPLRERQQDIPLLVQHFIEKYSPESNPGAMSFSPDAVWKLLLYKWPGNVRELEYIVQRTILLCETGEIRASDIDLLEDEAAPLENSFQESKARVVAEFEKTYIRDLLGAFQGNITKAAQAAKKNRRAFWELIRKHRINVKSFRPTAS